MPKMRKEGKGIEPISFGRGFLQEVTNQNRQDNPPQRHKAICADCKRETEVPFKPAGDRPVYCRECYAKRKSQQ